MEYKQQVTIDGRGAILFPAIVRKATGLEKGSRAIIELKNGKLTIYRADLELE
jgi:AbrB family looped-hinge helix DNA binding protein